MEVLAPLLVLGLIVGILTKAMGVSPGKLVPRLRGGGAFGGSKPPRNVNLMLAMSIAVIAQLALDPQMIGAFAVNELALVGVLVGLVCVAALAPAVGDPLLAALGLAVTALNLHQEHGAVATVGVVVLAVMLAWFAGLFRRFTA